MGSSYGSIKRRTRQCQRYQSHSIIVPIPCRTDTMSCTDGRSARTSSLVRSYMAKHCIIYCLPMSGLAVPAAWGALTLLCWHALQYMSLSRCAGTVTSDSCLSGRPGCFVERLPGNVFHARGLSGHLEHNQHCRRSGMPKRQHRSTGVH